MFYSNKGTKTVKKNSNRSNLQGNHLHVQHTFLYIFLPMFLHDYNVKLSETSWFPVTWRKCYTCSCLFLTSLISPWWEQAFLILSPPLQDFLLFLQQRMFPLLFLSQLFPSLSFASLSPYFLFFSVFLCLYIPNLWA